MVTDNDHKEDLLNLIAVLDTAIASNRRRRLEPVFILLEHYIKQHHSSETSLKLVMNEHGHKLEQRKQSSIEQQFESLKQGFNTNRPTAHLIFSIRNLIEILAQQWSYEETEISAKSSAKKDDPLDIFKQYIESNEGRYTKTKESIVKAILATTEHFEVDSFMDTFREKNKKIARATVYRTIKQLLAAGLLQKIMTRSGRVFYEQSFPEQEHAHLICNKCGKLLEIKDDKIRSLLNKYCEKMKFKMQYQSIHIYGECLDKSKCKG